MFYRVYTFSGRSRSIAVYLGLQFIGIFSAMLILLLKFLENVEYTRWPGRLCTPIVADNSRIGEVFILLLLSSVVVVMAIMIYMALCRHRGLNSALLKVFYRDGVFYFFLLFAVTSQLLCATSSRQKGITFF